MEVLFSSFLKKTFKAQGLIYRIVRDRLYNARIDLGSERVKSPYLSSDSLQRARLPVQTSAGFHGLLTNFGSLHDGFCRSAEEKSHLQLHKQSDVRQSQLFLVTNSHRRN